MRSKFLFAMAFLDLPTYHQGDPTYAVTFAMSLALVVAILGAALASALREGNATYKEKRHSGRE